MRLIDADKLLYDDIKDIHGDTLMVVHAPEIDEAPTAFDKEKVIDELLKASIQNCVDDEPYVMLDTAMAIIEKGGIE